MGAGKTTIGRRLAKKLGWKFIDLDEEIERRGNAFVDETRAADLDVAILSMDEIFAHVHHQIVEEASDHDQAGGADREDRHQ